MTLRAALMAVLLGLMLISSGAQPVGAISVDQNRLADPQLEARAHALFRTLRCVVCDNQSIDDSDAGVAADLRALVREQVAAGASDEEITAYLVARYGDFILLQPPLRLRTLLLWLLPFGLLGFGLLAFLRGLWRRRVVITVPTDRAAETASTAAPSLSTEEQQRLTRWRERG